jgi:hypothetical protein
MIRQPSTHVARSALSLIAAAALVASSISVVSAQSFERHGEGREPARATQPGPAPGSAFHGVPGVARAYPGGHVGEHTALGGPGAGHYGSPGPEPRRHDPGFHPGPDHRGGWANPVAQHAPWGGGHAWEARGGFGWNRGDGGWHAGWGWGGGWSWNGVAVIGGPSALFFTPLIVFAPPPIYVAPPPIMLGIPALVPPPLVAASPPPAAVPSVAVALPPPEAVTPEALLLAAAPPPIVILPPPAIVIAAAPPTLFFAPPFLAFASFGVLWGSGWGGWGWGGHGWAWHDPGARVWDSHGWASHDPGPHGWQSHAWASHDPAPHGWASHPVGFRPGANFAPGGMARVHEGGPEMHTAFRAPGGHGAGRAGGERRER